jgi:tetrahydromethanopterin S-methyltransferase subunit D
MRKAEAQKASFFERHSNAVGLLIVFGLLFLVGIVVFVFAKPCLPCALKNLAGG